MGSDVAMLVMGAVLGAAAAAVVTWWACARRAPASGAGVDGQLRMLGDELGRVTDVLMRLEGERSRQHGELAAQLTATAEQAASLGATSAALREVLASPKARGQWGERAAEDVLRAAGFVEGVSYVTQRATRSGTVPDFTFLLPEGLVLHMDAKFPLAAYVRCLEASTEHERSVERAAFLRDVRARVKELTTRGYVDPGDGTLDYVLLFIPNESVYAFVHEHDPALLDHALRSKVVLCSPLTLFALLAVVRRAVDAFALERTSDEILAVLGSFATQWERFCESLDKVGRAVDAVERAYGDLAGTRRRALERPLARIDELRRERGAAAVAGGEGLRVVGEAVAADGTGR